MGKNTTGEKPKFDLITASKTKKYKIITAVVLLIGVLCLAGGLLMHSFVTKAVTPNNLKLNNLSGWKGGEKYVISTDESFTLSTGNVFGRPLTDPITFTLLDGADQFVEVWDSESKQITSSYYAGVFYFHIKAGAPTRVQNEMGLWVAPSGTVVIRCGSHVVKIVLEYQA